MIKSVEKNLEESLKFLKNRRSPQFSGIFKSRILGKLFFGDFYYRFSGISNNRFFSGRGRIFSVVEFLDQILQNIWKTIFWGFLLPIFGAMKWRFRGLAQN